MILNSFGDMFFLFAMTLLVFFMQSLDFYCIIFGFLFFKQFKLVLLSTFGYIYVVDLINLCFFIAVISKSSQYILHI